MAQMLHWYLHPKLTLRPRHAWMARRGLSLTDKQLVAMLGYQAEDWEAMAGQWT